MTTANAILITALGIALSVVLLRNWRTATTGHRIGAITAILSIAPLIIGYYHQRTPVLLLGTGMAVIGAMMARHSFYRS
jgi:zinc transporter ZupT